MTRQERRIAELAAQDLEGWALELPLGSETRWDLQQTARALDRPGLAEVPREIRPRLGRGA